MSPALGRRSRSTFDSDEDSLSSREATPLSTAPNDAKRARRSLPSDEPDSDDGSEARTVAPGRRQSPASTIPSSAQRSRQNVIDDDDDDDVEEDEDEDPEDEDRHPLSRAPSNGILMSRRSEINGAGQKRKHQPGAIVRVKVTNFVTYTSAEFFPGPNLNMVIGPNGTGKSSLVCAICLGLGWGPQHLGRAKEVSEFIKNGCREATIEIELQKGETGLNSRQNPIFTRHMKREGNKSTYMINGNASNNKQVMALARSFSVQIDNLCQFLPQDRVVEFSQMSPENLLHSTQRAVAPELLEHHTALIKIREKQKDIVSNRKHDKEMLKNLENRQEGQRLEVENTRRRAEIKQRLVWLEKCRPMTLYNDALQKSRAAKELQKQLTLELKELEQEVAPALRRVNEKEKYEKETFALKKHREKELKDGERACDDLEKQLENCDDNLKEIETNSTAERSSSGPKKQEKLKHQQKIRALERQIEEGLEPFDPVRINEELHRMTNRKRELDATLEETKLQMRNSQTHGKGNVEAIQTMRDRLKALDTQAGQQLSKLEAASKDTHAAWNWIQENQSEFQKPVFGPPMVTCSLRDPRMAKVVESMFQQSDFKIITVQCLQDFNTCQRKLIREKKWFDISIRVCSINSLDQFRPPMPQEQLRQLGLDGWAIDFIDGPATVIAMLCSEKSLHQNGVGMHDITDAQYHAIARTGMKSFAAGGTSYRLINRAEYGEAGKATAAKAVRNPQIWTDKPVDGGLKDGLQRRINEMKGENAELHQAIDQLKKTALKVQEDLGELEPEIDKLRMEKAEHQKAQVNFAKLPQQKIQLEEKVNAIDEFLEGVKLRIADLRDRFDQTALKKATLAATYAAAVSRLRILNEQLLEAELMHIEALSDFQTLKSRNEDIHNLLTTKRQEEQHAVKVAAEKKQAGREIMKDVHGLRAEGKKRAEEGDPALNDLFEEIAAKHSSPEGYKPEDLEADIDTIKADLELVQGGDQRVIDEYEKREETIRNLKGRLDNSKAKDDEIAAVIQETRDLWETKLDELVGTISDKFSENFARIGCAGNVVVYKANAPAEEVEDDLNVEKNPEGNGLDFANWALHISVKFREAEPLSLLDSHRQSGGERAVSTIFYLMALQSLSRAPFRVVDEINQGMDPRNERMVHGRMVDIAAGNGEDGKGGSQYFLVTPKLLNGLKYKPGMTVLCIVSGENMPAAGTDGASRVDFRKLVERARDLGLNRQPVSRRIDSGVAMGSSFDTDEMYGNGHGEERLNRASLGSMTSVGA